MSCESIFAVESEKLLHEHEALHELILEVSAAVAKREASPREMHALVQALTEHVTAHFKHEEQGGYFREVVKLEPRLSDRVNALLTQHEEMAAQLDLLLCVTENAASDWREKARETYEAFFSVFQEHEAAENDLLQQAYSEDIGAKD